MPSSVNTGRKTSSRGRSSFSWNQLKRTSFGESRSYLLEYGLLLLLTGGLVYVITAMVHSFYEKVSVIVPLVDFRDSDVFLLSALTVVLPLVIILIQRTAETEHADPAVKNLAWRKAFLGIFVAVISVWAIVSSVLFINSILEYLSNGLLSGEDFNWQLSLKYFVSSLILIVTAWAFGNDYRYVARDHFVNLRHSYRYGLVVTSLVIGLLFLLFPFRDNRTTYADEQIANDIYSISSLVDSYNTGNGKLPLSLNDISLTKDQLQRSKNYNYTLEAQTDNSYQICADFNKGGSDVAASAAGTNGLPDVAIHTSGNNCFTFTVSSPANVQGAATDTGDMGMDSSVQTVPTTSEEQLY